MMPRSLALSFWRKGGQVGERCAGGTLICQNGRGVVEPMAATGAQDV